MEAKDFYNKRIKEEPAISNIQLMEEYAKHIIKINFCDGFYKDLNELTDQQTEKLYKNIKLCTEWANQF